MWSLTSHFTRNAIQVLRAVNASHSLLQVHLVAGSHSVQSMKFSIKVSIKAVGLHKRTDYMHTCTVYTVCLTEVTLKSLNYFSV